MELDKMEDDDDDFEVMEVDFTDDEHDDGEEDEW